MAKEAKSTIFTLFELGSLLQPAGGICWGRFSPLKGSNYHRGGPEGGFHRRGRRGGHAGYLNGTRNGQSGKMADFRSFWASSPTSTRRRHRAQPSQPPQGVEPSSGRSGGKVSPTGKEGGSRWVPKRHTKWPRRQNRRFSLLLGEQPHSNPPAVFVGGVSALPRGRTTIGEVRREGFTDGEGGRVTLGT